MTDLAAVSDKINIFWFRRDLRLDDNAGLYHALSAGLPVLPVFIFDKNILDDLQDKDDARVSFIHAELEKINNSLHKIGSGLVVYHGVPEKIWQQITKQYNIDTVFFNHDYEPYAHKRDDAVTTLLHAKDIKTQSYKDQVIFENSEITKDDGKPYIVFTPYSRRWKSSLSMDALNPFPSEQKLEHSLKFKPDSPPNLNDLGFTSTRLNFPDRTIPENIVADYDKTRNTPGIKGTSRLGVHLRFGTVSIRRLVREAMQLNEIWLTELIWREFFMMILSHFPHVLDAPFKQKYANIPWRNDENDFNSWCEGRTGFPMVDAGMRELNATGYMHNRVRMITASFLTKHLLVDWRRGERYFARRLLDFELASNNGNWQWVAGCGCDAAPYFRIFNPTSQAEKFDPEQKYIRQWIPEYGTDEYPDPIVEHAYARERALDTYKSVL
jgi:deoxyribodipyrimidine photo-lyase